MKSASCTTTSLFIVIFSKNSFSIRSLDTETVLQQRSFSKADAKVVSFTIQSKSFYEKYAQKHVVFGLFYKTLQKQGKYTFYIFMRAKGLWTITGVLEMKGREKPRGLSPEKREKRGKERRHGRGGRKGKGDNVEGKDAERRKK